MVQGGADNIMESGDLTEVILTETITARRTAGVMTKALAISVQDSGEEAIQDWHYAQYVTVRIFDRDRGYGNIRTVKQELIELLRGQFAEFPSGAKLGLMDCRLADRTGHRYDKLFNVEYEAIRFRGVVLRAGGQSF